MVTFLAPSLRAVTALSMAALPPPITTTRSPNVISQSRCSIRAMLTSRSRSSAWIIPESSSPGRPSLYGRLVPVPIKTALYCSSNETGLSMGCSVWILTPRDCMYFTSCLTTSLGRRYAGMPYIRTPPGCDSDSKRSTSYPRRFKMAAAESPAGPEPTTATLMVFSRSDLSGLGPFSISWSAANR